MQVESDYGMNESGRFVHGMKYTEMNESGLFCTLYEMYRKICTDYLQHTHSFYQS